MSRITVAADVDGTILTDITNDWFYDLKYRYPLKDQWKHVVHPRDYKLPYSIPSIFNIPEGEDKLKFWDDEYLYDFYDPRKDAVDCLAALNDLDYDVIFVSKVCGRHGVSKTNFINKYFPYNKGVILTGQKHYVQCDYLVDDSTAVLNTMKDTVKTIKFRDDFDEGVQAVRKHKLVYGFEEVFKYIVEGK